MNINDMRTEDIEEYLEKRHKHGKRPTPRHSTSNMEKLIKFCEGILDDFENEGYSKDHQYFTYEFVFELIYGDDIHKFIQECEER